ncbi:MAG TPA: carboxymuconolactone decarboxylase family protein [Steroidobacteraceae bacterium]|jgi:4-carboxymuconolactone decarboxylase|nr:carboxymuconolactone decarboxylase family protein [Steroidobacteraceae bacterium]
MSDTRTETGRQVVREMLGEGFLQGLEAHIATGTFGSEAGRLALAGAFGDIWGRPGLERKYRSMVTLAVLIALRAPHELQNHVRAALANGCSADEIEEVIIQTIPYVGYPAVSIALNAAAEVLKEKGLLKSPTTAQDRGL